MLGTQTNYGPHNHNEYGTTLIGIIITLKEFDTQKMFLS